MRSSMKTIIVCGEVILFGLLAAAVVPVAAEGGGGGLAVGSSG